LLVLVLKLISDASSQGHIFIYTLGTLVPQFAY